MSDFEYNKFELDLNTDILFQEEEVEEDSHPLPAD